MAKLTGQATDREHLERWRRYCDNFRNATPVDLAETPAERMRRVAGLEKDDEAWFSYYFPNYCTAEPADFHRKATRRLMAHPEWFEVRAWSRELAKSARSMMEICKLALTGRVHNVLLVSNSHDNAESLLLPFKAFFEANGRVTNDYGAQRNFGQWADGRFTIRRGCSFRAIGWGESPRGTRNNERRPDFILMDDLDTDEECRNEETMKKKIAWIEQALIPTRSISTPTRILVNGNIIHDSCAVKYLGENLADKFEVVNIRDAEGRSTWPQKNSEEQIDRVLSSISYESSQKEYFNNPMDGGDTFRDLKEGRVPPLAACRVLIYADPATSNQDRSNASYKAVGLLAERDGVFYVVKAACDTMSNAKFIDCLYEFYCCARRQSPGAETRVWVENNTLQDPFYEQVLLPLIYERRAAWGCDLPITPDTRRKPEKWERIEATLEPLNRLGRLVFNGAERDDPHMRRLMAQFRNASRRAKRLDGPDMVEGGVFILKNTVELDSCEVMSIPRSRAKRL